MVLAGGLVLFNVPDNSDDDISPILLDDDARRDEDSLVETAGIDDGEGEGVNEDGTSGGNSDSSFSNSGDGHTDGGGGGSSGGATTAARA